MKVKPDELRKCASRPAVLRYNCGVYVLKCCTPRRTLCAARHPTWRPAAPGSDMSHHLAGCFDRCYKHSACWPATRNTITIPPPVFTRSFSFTAFLSSVSTQVIYPFVNLNTSFLPHRQHTALNYNAHSTDVFRGNNPVYTAIIILNLNTHCGQNANVSATYSNDCASTGYLSVPFQCHLVSKINIFLPSIYFCPSHFIRGNFGLNKITKDRSPGRDDSTRIPEYGTLSGMLTTTTNPFLIFSKVLEKTADQHYMQVWYCKAVFLNLKFIH